MVRTAAARPANHWHETATVRNIEYLSAPAAVSMADRWFEIAAIDHFWIRRGFDVLRRLAGGLISGAREIAEIGCGHGLLQPQIGGADGRAGTGFDPHGRCLRQNIILVSEAVCYDRCQ